MNSSHLGNSKHKRPTPLSDITQYVNMDIHGNNLTVEDKPKENNYKTVMCKSWIQSGSCSYGKKCRFAHGEHELREPARLVPEQHKTKLCEKYTVEGICPYGKRCNYIHPAMCTTSGLQQPALPAHFKTGYPPMMCAVPGMYGTLAGPPCYPLSLLPYSNYAGRAEDLAHFYGQQSMFFEDNGQQFPRLTDGCGFPTGGMSHLNMRMNKPWNDCDQAAMPVVCDLSGNINGTSKARAPLLPPVSRNEAGCCSAARSDLINSNNNNFTAEPWNGRSTMPQMCGLFGNVNDASKPRTSLLPLESCDKAVSCSAAYSHPTNNNVCGLLTSPLCSSTPAPKSFTSSLGSDIWSPEKRMNFDPLPACVSVQEVGEKPLKAPVEHETNRDVGIVDNFTKWIEGFDTTSKAQGYNDEFKQWFGSSEKKHSDDGTAPGERRRETDSLFRGLFEGDCFSLWKP